MNRYQRYLLLAFCALGHFIVISFLAFFTVLVVLMYMVVFGEVYGLMTLPLGFAMAVMLTDALSKMFTGKPFTLDYFAPRPFIDMEPSRETQQCVHCGKSN